MVFSAIKLLNFGTLPFEKMFEDKTFLPELYSEHLIATIYIMLTDFFCSDGKEFYTGSKCMCALICLLICLNMPLLLFLSSTGRRLLVNPTTRARYKVLFKIACKENAKLWNEATDHDEATRRMKLLTNYLVHQNVISSSHNAALTIAARQDSDEEDVELISGRRRSLIQDADDISSSKKRARSPVSPVNGVSVTDDQAPPGTPSSEEGSPPNNAALDDSPIQSNRRSAEEQKVVLLSFFFYFFLLTFVASSGQRASLNGKTILTCSQEQSRSSN